MLQAGLAMSTERKTDLQKLTELPTQNILEIPPLLKAASELHRLFGIPLNGKDNWL